MSCTSRDNANGRILSTEQPDNGALTIESCITFCQSGNFSLAGTEFGVQCCEYLVFRRDILWSTLPPSLNLCIVLITSQSAAMR